MTGVRGRLLRSADRRVYRMLEKLAASTTSVPAARQPLSRHAEAGVGLLAVALINALVWVFYASAMSTEHRLSVMGTTNEVLGVLMIASPELGEIVSRARTYLKELLLLGKFLLIFFWVSRRVQDPVKRSVAEMFVLLCMVLTITRLTGRVAEATVSEPPEGWKAFWVVYRADRAKAALEAEIYARKLTDRHLPLRLLGVLLVVVGLVVGLFGHIHTANATTTVTTTVTATITTTTATTTTTTIKQVPAAPRAFMWFAKTWTASKMPLFEQAAFRHGHTPTSLMRLYVEHPTVREVFGLRR